jgi:DMSO/TMAO reductase YedYZ molybdopterin-dependent catalytic subunit
MAKNDTLSEEDRFQALFEGRKSDVLREFQSAPVATSVIADKKQKFAKLKKSFQTSDRDTDDRRIPPGQSRSFEWPILDLGNKPVIDPEDWSLSVAGLVERPIRWGWADLMRQPQIKIKSDIHCVTAWSRLDNEWAGISAKHLLSVIRPKPQARFLVFHGYDGYTTNIPLHKFDDDDVMIAHQWQGKPISREHGGPVRVVIPSLYFWKSAKWVRHIAFLEHDVKGYWETRGYHNDGDPWKQQRYE